MEYMALFIWLCLCLLLGGLIHYVMTGALAHRPIQLLAAPGMVMRKFTMTLTALLCGGTVTRVRIYELSSRDINFEADGTAGVAKVLVPLAPLFGGALAVMALNTAFGAPLHFDYTPPSLASLDGGGLRGFLEGTGALLTRVVRQGARADWRSPRIYVLFALLFSMALGGCAPLERIKEAALGAGLLAVLLALVSTVAVRRGPGGMSVAAPWFANARDFVVTASAAAFVMMVYGILVAIAVGVVVRIYELIVNRGKGGGRKKKTATLPSSGERKEAA
ncbi:MAG: hypothetical protein R6X33_04725 [Candidatus Brocadiia bacterium]